MTSIKRNYIQRQRSTFIGMFKINFSFNKTSVKKLETSAKNRVYYRFIFIHLKYLNVAYEKKNTLIYIQFIGVQVEKGRCVTISSQRCA